MNESSENKSNFVINFILFLFLILILTVLLITFINFSSLVHKTLLFFVMIESVLLVGAILSTLLTIAEKKDEDDLFNE